MVHRPDQSLLNPPCTHVSTATKAVTGMYPLWKLNAMADMQDLPYQHAVIISKPTILFTSLCPMSLCHVSYDPPRIVS